MLQLIAMGFTSHDMVSWLCSSRNDGAPHVLSLSSRKYQIPPGSSTPEAGTWGSTEETCKGVEGPRQGQYGVDAKSVPSQYQASVCRGGGSCKAGSRFDI